MRHRAHDDVTATCNDRYCTQAASGLEPGEHMFTNLVGYTKREDALRMAGLQLCFETGVCPARLACLADR